MWVIDLIEMEAIVYDETTLGARFHREAIPEAYQAVARSYRERLLETLADQNDLIMEQYVNGSHIDSQNVRAAVRQATLGSLITPVLCGAAFKNKGIQPLLDGIIHYLPC